ncbi:glycosyltransferase family 39 protein [Synechococcus sp. CS-602]|uniref:ArnT family glycosyltransferase n=1 Tax=Synechococcaceae TaxID=1890426 RepID=UPI00223BC398|nr:MULTISPECIES: glycosyltransferase family 39 protein [Synechococcaceae]MCT0204435.1 glycosyltransferase family 39 protein [Synechococcus sp. CS-602]MCT4368687.1 glycosyltransferase family 39 protein [Candidatus Regnicoccus frigidus MAG-AL2]
MLLIVLAIGIPLFLWQLGATGLVDETPPLFAGSARAMAESGNWLTPWVNGLPRYDKPPLVYWLMALVYALPGQEQWNPLGTWAARLPSGLASIGVMLSLAFTLLRWPQPGDQSGEQPTGTMPSRPQVALTALTAALAFALSPLTLLWSRIAVSDALFSGCLSVALLLFWQCWAEPRRPWWPGWLVLGLAVLSKGPVALVLAGLTLLGFGWRQGALAALWRRLRPVQGLGLSLLVSLPWYAAMLVVEGRPFWDSFFGYHNLQRFSSVVNDHLQPWWYFLPVMVVASLPFTPLLGLGLARGLRDGARQGTTRGEGGSERRPASASLRSFAACWLLAVLVFFTLAATKLPSYWLPATPAAALLIALAAQDSAGGRLSGGRLLWLAQGLTLSLTFSLAVGLWMSALWVPLINDPEMPTLPAELLASRLVYRAAFCFSIATVAGLWPWLRGWSSTGWSRGLAGWLLGLQLPLVAFHLFAVLPMWQLGDGVRGLPVREMAAAARREVRPGESLAMVGVLKPSLHYYSRQVVLYEGLSASGLVNLSDRLDNETRRGQRPAAATSSPTVLVVIDASTSQLPYWQNLGATPLASNGIYRLWRVERARLDQEAERLQAAGKARISWRDPRPERY